MLIVLLSSSAIVAQASVRGIWVVRHNMTDSIRIDRLLQFANDNEITDLFVQVRGRGDAYFKSDIEPNVTRHGK